MKTFLLVLLLATTVAQAHTETEAAPTYVHRKFALPAPHERGELIVEADYVPENNTSRFRSITVRIGAQTIEVPKHIVDFFSRPNLVSIQFLLGPAFEPGDEYPSYFNRVFLTVAVKFGGVSARDSRCW